MSKRDGTELGCPDWQPQETPNFDSCKTKDDWKVALKAIGYPEDPMFPFDVNRWGSCQYSTALAIYDLYFKIRETLDIEETLEVLGVKIQHNGLRPFEEVKKSFVNHAIDRYHDYEPDRHRVDACRVNSYDEMFFVKRNWSTDLWNAAPHICQLAFTNFKIEAPKSPGLGPVCNCEVQSSNFVTGICCAYLKDNGVVKDEKSFANFDT